MNKKKKKDLDFDEEFDKALAAAGLLKKANPAAEKPSSSSNGNHDDNSTNGNLYSKYNKIFILFNLYLHISNRMMFYLSIESKK